MLLCTTERTWRRKGTHRIQDPGHLFAAAAACQSSWGRASCIAIRLTCRLTFERGSSAGTQAAALIADDSEALDTAQAALK